MNKKSKQEDLVASVIKNTLNREIPQDVEHRMQGHLAQFRRKLDARELLAEMPRQSWHPVFRVAAAVACALIIFAGVSLVPGAVGTPTWAEVVERFDSVPYFDATFYVMADDVSDPLKIELWMSRGGKMRMRAGNEVIFGNAGRITDRFIVAPPSPTSQSLEGAQSMVQHFVERVGTAESFSFNTLLAAIPSGSTPSGALSDMNASILNDLIVYDMKSERSPEWVRIQALRESRLPVRVRFWHEETSESIDVAISYGNQQSDDFFNPRAFEKRLDISAANEQTGQAHERHNGRGIPQQALEGILESPVPSAQ